MTNGQPPVVPEGAIVSINEPPGSQVITPAKPKKKKAKKVKAKSNGKSRSKARKVKKKKQQR